MSIRPEQVTPDLGVMKPEMVDLVTDDTAMVTQLNQQFTPCASGHSCSLLFISGQLCGTSWAPLMRMAIHFGLPRLLGCV